MELTKNVLICVEQDIMLTALKFRLEKQGYNVIHVKNVKEVKVAILSTELDLIITDLQMKGVSAVDIVKWSKKKNNGSVSPFLVMTTLDDDGETLIKALDNGADDFIMKPFKPVELYFRINRLVPTLDV